MRCGFVISLACCALLSLTNALSLPAEESLTATPTFPATDWPWWRGPARDGIAHSDQSPPLSWSEKQNVLWKAEVPGRGHSSPIIVGERIFLTTADEKQEIQSVRCYARDTG